MNIRIPFIATVIALLFGLTACDDDLAGIG